MCGQELDARLRYVTATQKGDDDAGARRQVIEEKAHVLLSAPWQLMATTTQGAEKKTEQTDVVTT